MQAQISLAALLSNKKSLSQFSSTTSASKENSKDYVREYIRGFMEKYDFSRPIIVQGAMIPSLMMESDLANHQDMLQSASLTVFLLSPYSAPLL